MQLQTLKISDSKQGRREDSLAPGHEERETEGTPKACRYTSGRLF